MELAEDSLLVARSGNASCELDGEAVVLNVDTGLYHGLDPVGSRIWTLVQQGVSFRGLREQLLEEYDVAPEVLTADLRRVLGEMRAAGLIEVRPA